MDNEEIIEYAERFVFEKCDSRSFVGIGDVIRNEVHEAVCVGGFDNPSVEHIPAIVTKNLTSGPMLDITGYVHVFSKSDCWKRIKVEQIEI